MTITYPLSFPTTVNLSDFQIDLQSAVGRSESPFSYAEQVQDWGGRKWVISGRLPQLRRDTASEFYAFLVSLQGRKGTFTMRVQGSESPLGSFSGSPVVDGSSQTGDTLNVRGLDASVTDIIKAGSFFHYGTGDNTRLHMVVQNASSDSNGDATLTIAPDLKSSPNDGTALNFNNPQGVFRLDQNISGYGVDFTDFYSMQFRAIEVI